MKQILFPTDFSDEAARALPVAAQLAHQLNAEIQLIYVLPPLLPPYAPRLYDTYNQYQQAIEVVEEEFVRWLAMPCLQHLAVHKNLLVGIDPVNLLDDPRFAHADLLVMASSGATGFKETLLGSNAEHLIRRANMPVLVLKNAPGYLNVQTVVFASDFEESNHGAMAFLQTLLDSFDSPAVHLLFVNTLKHFVPSSEIQARMEAFSARYRLGACTLNQQNEFDVEAGVLAFVKDKNADLVVLGTHGWRGLHHLLVGSIAEDVANHAPIPVLTLPLRSEADQSHKHPIKSAIL